MMEHLAQVILLLAVAVAVVVAFQRLHVPTSLGYLLVGLILGPHTIGPTVYMPQFAALAEFGVVFLLFTIGLNFSLPQLHALRHQVLGLGTGQVVLTTAVVAIVLWFAGLPGEAAFVFGAVFAQSSTTIIASQLREQGEESSRHGRMGLAMSVFQDVTAVPFLVVIPVLGISASAVALAGELGWALAKAALAFALVFVVGRWLLRPLFRLVTARRSAEAFTLAVLMVALMAAWTTNSLGLSLAFGGFLAGMMLGETEFRHQIEASIRPFRDVLLGLFFVGIGMLIDPTAIGRIWHWAILGALLIVLSKLLIVAAMVRASKVATQESLRVGLLLSVGGEFGFALIAIALGANVIDADLSQIALTSVLFAMIVGALLIRFNGAIAGRVVPSRPVEVDQPEGALDPTTQKVLIGGYGRVGHTVAVLLHDSGVPFVAFDANPTRVMIGRQAGHAVSYGDISDPDLLATIHAERSALIILTIDDADTAVRAVNHLRKACPQVPIIARARDLEATGRLLQAGATQAYPEAVEASLKLGQSALEMLRIASDDVEQIIDDVRNWDYQPVVEPTGTKKSRGATTDRG